jgi:hypothetical protein
VYSVWQYEKIRAWLDEHADDPDACHAMAVWLSAALTGPRDLANGALKREGRGHRLYFAVVPGADAMVTYFVGDAPIRLMSIVSVIPAP